MTMIAVLLFFAGIVAFGIFWLSRCNDRNSSAPGICLGFTIVCLGLSWAMFGFPT